MSSRGIEHIKVYQHESFSMIGSSSAWRQLVQTSLTDTKHYTI